MKKTTCILLLVCFSLVAFAKGSGRRYSAVLDNSQVVKSQKDEKRAVRNFGNRRYSGITRGRGFHPFGRRSGGSSRQESGLGQ